jgi:diadenylate cyclase
MTSVLDFLVASWRQAVEILILTVGIYYVINFVRGTRGASVVLGFVGLLVTLGLLTLLLDLNVVRALLAAAAVYLSIAVVVLFQPEIRRMLAQLGDLPMFNSAQQERENIEVIVQTVERLSDVRIGLLLAVERTVNLQQAVESGIEVDCVATPEMLETIFFPNNAVHDGGVILRGDRIAYAACIFPLSRRQDLSPSLGTRHRAAIGLTEETDAVVVVVSEESGAISYANRGQLVRRVTIEGLRAFLTTVLVQPRNGKTPWERFREFTRRARPGTVGSIKAPAPPGNQMRP